MWFFVLCVTIDNLKMGSYASACPSPNMDAKAVELVEEIKKTLPNAEDWLDSPHSLLGGETPAQRILAGDIDRVRNLVNSILYVGIT
jgi:Protein of unknown function (DUF2384)